MHRGLRAVRHAELCQHVADVGLDRLLGHAELERDALVGETPAEQFQHLALAPREAIAQPAGAPPPQRLTTREREVLTLIGRGYANKRIALELGVAEKTVKTHVGHVLAKLGLSDRTQAALYAVREGLAPG